MKLKWNTPTLKNEMPRTFYHHCIIDVVLITLGALLIIGSAVGGAMLAITLIEHLSR
jgi:hypothetical protein